MNDTEKVAAFLHIQKRDVLLDTNVLMQAFSAKAKHVMVNEGIRVFCKQNNIYICDTVYWEFLRNSSIETFRVRHKELQNWIVQAALRKGSVAILHEAYPEVQRRFEELTLVSLYLHKHSPEQFIHSTVADRWIIACALTHGVHHILTMERQGNDYPEQLFDTATYTFSSECTLRLHTYNEQKGNSLWGEILESEGVIPLNISAYKE
jgi:predicted nucleic acid-binding protein